MIPKQLQIKNFLSYGPEQQTIDFLSYNLICLSGKNGHGKSALLDAMTWALWGQGRKTTGTSKADEGLVHLGQKHMLVTFDFEINGIAYRVRREFVKTQSSPFSALDFGIVKDDGSFTTLTDKTIKATQEKLEKTIGITFESFVNSAFLRQGQANEFSKKSAKERKEILATILQLERFEDLKKVAVEKTKILYQQILQKQSILDRITQEIEQLERALEEQNLLGQQLQTLQEEESTMLKIIEQNEQKKLLLVEHHKTYELLTLQQSEYTKQITDITQQIALLEKTYQKIAEEQKNYTHIRQVEEEHQQIRTVVAQHQEKLNKRLELKDQYLTLQEKKQALEKELMQAESLLHQQYEISSTILQEQINQQKLQQTKLHSKITQDQQTIKEQKIIVADQEKNIAHQAKTLESFAAYEKQFEEHNNQYQRYKAQRVMLEHQINELQQKHTLSLQNQDPSCPLCEQNLSASRKKFLEQKFQQNHTQLQADLLTSQKNIATLQKTLTVEHARIQQYKKEHDTLTQSITQAQAEQEQLNKIIAQSLQEEQQLIIINKKITELQSTLEQLHLDHKKKLQSSTHHEQNLAYQTFIKKIEALKQTAQTLAYNKEAHDKDFQHLKSIEDVLLSYQSLQTEIAQQDQRRQQLNELYERAKKINEICKEIDQKLSVIKDSPLNLIEHAKIEQQDKQQLQTIVTTKLEALNKKAIYDLQAQKKIQLHQEQSFIDKDIKSVHSDIADLTEIAKALGKDGLQALLIEQALPEIEQEANILLAQLTDNQTQIFIESLRDLKKGGSKETLDIKISDAIGVRPYEMFSGGEAFRIDFALRIAISKLLARRAGTALQTLIIDEGFGSQDDDGLQLIMDSILKIQDNFAKVIIVSHLPSMKENFPVQFLVQKKASGSIVTVIQQG